MSFALENPGKFCHWLRKSIALEQTAAVVYYSLPHFTNMSPLFSAKHSVKPRNLFIDDRNEISESSEVKNEECLCLAHWLANCVLSVLSWERVKSWWNHQGQRSKRWGATSTSRGILKYQPITSIAVVREPSTANLGPCWQGVFRMQNSFHEVSTNLREHFAKSRLSEAA